MASHERRRHLSQHKIFCVTLCRYFGRARCRTVKGFILHALDAPPSFFQLDTDPFSRSRSRNKITSTSWRDPEHSYAGNRRCQKSSLQLQMSLQQYLPTADVYVRYNSCSFPTLYSGSIDIQYTPFRSQDLPEKFLWKLIGWYRSFERLTIWKR